MEPASILVSDMHSALETGREFVRKIGELPQEQVLYGITFYSRKQWAEALIHLWTVTERLVEVAWVRNVIESISAIPKRRRAFLEDHRTWPVSTKLEMLAQKGLLTGDLLATLDGVRKTRNDFAHRGVQPAQEHATHALSGCFELASMCASDFKDSTLLQHVVATVIDRCDPKLYPEKRTFTDSEVSHWLSIPPIPGDKGWDERPYEINEDLQLKPIADGA
jgi:hypothetical protein